MGTRRIKTREIVSFYDLPKKWQAEAIRNLDEQAEESSYLMPLASQTPKHHILWDLTEAMRQTGNHGGFVYNAVIGISNNSAMLLNVSDDGESARFIIV